MYVGQPQRDVHPNEEPGLRIAEKKEDNQHGFSGVASFGASSLFIASPFRWESRLIYKAVHPIFSLVLNEEYGCEALKQGVKQVALPD